jgi:glucose/mannose-6-phosphate isomerase
MEKSNLMKIDKNLMHETYDQWPEIAKTSYESIQNPVECKEIDNIVFCGMGGSGTLSDFFASILSKTNIHVSIVKGYHLPHTADSKTLVISTSVSGNTLETLSVLNSALNKKCQTISFSNGGKMEEFCKKKKIPHRRIPMHNSPRASFPAYLYSMLKILYPVIPVKITDIKESFNFLDNFQKNISSKNIQNGNKALELASWITNVPMIYYPWGLQTAATRFKNSLQENTKMHVMSEEIMEACHNGIVCWERPTNIKPIFIRGEDDFVKTKERWGIFKEFFHEKNIEYKEIISVKGSILSKMICLIYFLDYVSIYRAILSEIDPTPVKSIEFIKSKIK